jgi:hypothetical protein
VLARLGGKVEQRVLHILHSTGGSIREQADVLLCRASRTARRGSLVMMLGGIGAALLVVGWAMFNVALHGFLTARSSATVAYLAVMGLNVIAGGGLLIVAIKLTLSVEGPPPLPRRSPAPRRWPPTHVPMVELRRAQAPEYKPQVLSLPPSELESALGATFELGMMAAQTLPLLMRALRKPSEPEAERESANVQ